DEPRRQHQQQRVSAHGARERVIDVGGRCVGATSGSWRHAAVYLRIENASSESDRLLAVSSPIATADVHQSTLDDSIMHMRLSDRVEIPAEGDVRLQPGGTHVMLMDIRQPLRTGDEVTLTLTFERTGT